MKPPVQHISRRPYVLLLPAVFLFLVSLFFNAEYSQRTSLRKEKSRLEKYLHDQQRDFLALLQDTATIRKFANRKESLAEFTRLTKKPYGIYLFIPSFSGEYKMVFWSNQEILPPEKYHTLPGGEYFEKLDNGYYLCHKQALQFGAYPASVIAYAMIPVQYEYFVETDYLPHRFAYDPEADKRVVIAKGVTDHSVESLSGKTLLYLDNKPYTMIAQTTGVVLWLRLVALIFLVLFIHSFAEMICRNKGAWFGIATLALVLFVLRLAGYFLNFPFPLRQFDLFDPSVYAANTVQKSLGDLLINAILFCWFSLFAWSKLAHVKMNHEDVVSKQKTVKGILAIVILVFFTFNAAGIIQSLASDSKISFDVTDFFSLNKYSVIGFAVLAVISTGFYYFTRVLSKFILAVFPANSWWIYFAIGVTGLFYLSFMVGSPRITFLLFVLVWLMIYTWLLYHPGFFVNRFRLNLATTLFWIFLFSSSITAIVIEVNREKEWEIRKLMADKLDVQSDPVNERQLSISFAYLDNDFLVDNFYRFYDEYENRQLRDSILSQSGYLNKYDTRLYIFNAKGEGLYNEDPESYNALNTILTVQAKPTNTPQLYYYETSFDRFTFILKRQGVDDARTLLGTIFIVSNPKKYSSDALYPELFKQANQNHPEESPLYAYAVYKNNTLVSPSGKYPFATSLTESQYPSQEFERRVNGDFDELWYKPSGNKVVVIAKKRASLIEVITLFSYVFCSFLFLVALLSLLALLLRAIYNRRELSRMFQLNIRIQVHSTIIFISLLSFIIIGIATISFFNSRFRSSNIDKLSRTMSIMVNEMRKSLEKQNVFDDVITIYDSVSNNELEALVNEVAEIHNVDVNVYDTEGNLQVSSQQLVYREGFLTKKIHPIAFYHLNRMRQVQHVQQENMATFSYQSIYAPVRDQDGEVYAYLNIPYFLSQRELNQEISNFLVTIINLNAFIFLIAGVIALFITNRITRSFSLISEKMQEVNLGKANEEIEWNRNDEIGELVKEYNKMVNKLEESAAALARSEREGAWREMARQVAHEIKNPLTPMKLSIQYLQKSIDNNSVNVKELTASVAKTLVEQIDHLSKIAFDFSQFANISNTNVELFDLHEVLQSLSELYRSNENVDFTWHPLSEKLMIKADRTQMNRLFTNLFQNAVEAGNGDEKTMIRVTETKTNGNIRFSIEDNGEGIAQEMQSKIFIPNFTTKSSGTGLGLAMCKSIVEQAQGKIWFETLDGEGTTFYVELPLVT